MIEVINVKKDYVKGKLTTKALKGISFTLNDHGFISILGPSGCGKSTLLNLLGLLDRPTEGKILIDNEDLSSISTKRQDELRNKKIGFIFQSYHLIPTLTAYENVSLPLSLNTSLSKKEVKEKAEKLLKDVGLFDLKNKYPSELSGGQAQRVAIARSLVNDPTIILADEPTGALDSENSLEITKILKDISAKHLVVVVTNNNELSKELENAGNETGETVWRMPLSKLGGFYDKQIDSEIADVRNTGKTRDGGSITAGQFLQRFINNHTKWAHIDIAATAFVNQEIYLTQKFATGYGVRLLNELIIKNYEK